MTQMRSFCRASDYWEGYKLFCFAYYSHSVEHETEFRHSKLGSCFLFPGWFFEMNLSILGAVPPSRKPRTVGPCQCLKYVSVFAGQIVWRRHPHLPPPSHHALRTTCMQILPLVEMYCKWEMQEDCNDLGALMHRFDHETELESHELGRSLLFMIHNDDASLPGFHRHEPIAVPDNPFAVLRERLAAVDLAIHDLHTQVQCPAIILYQFYARSKFAVSFIWAFTHSIP